MEDIIDHLKRTWKIYVIAIWMIGVTVFLSVLNDKLNALQDATLKLNSDVDSVESILVSTDSNVAETKKAVDEMIPQVVSIHKRVMRRR